MIYVRNWRVFANRVTYPLTMLRLPNNIPLFNFYTVEGNNILILQLQHEVLATDIIACVSGSCDGNKLIMKILCG